MAITPETPGGINAPNDLSSEAASNVAAPNTLTSKTAGAVAAPNTLASESAGSVAAPNTLASESAGSVAAPNTLTSEAAGSIAAPNTLISESAGAVAAPNTLTSESVASVAIPNTLTSESASSVAIPNTLTSETAASVAAPNTIGAVAAAALPRTLTPMLKLNFAHDSYQQNGTAKSLLDIVTYSRASSATFINRQLNEYGQYEYFVDTDYVGNVENLITYSEQFDSSAWNLGSTTVTANATKAPGGTTSADKLTASGSTGSYKGRNVSVTSGQEHTFSAYFKNIDSTRTLFYCSTTTKQVYINWSGNTITSLSNISSGATASYKKVGDFYRVELTFTTSSTSEICRIYPDTTNGTGSIYAWGAQLTESAKALPYVKTIDTTVTKAFTETVRREYDPETGKNLGVLIEGGSTNLLTRSEQFDSSSWLKWSATVTANAAKAPDGTMSADKITASGTSASTYQTVTVTSGQEYTFSAYLKNINSVRTAFYCVTSNKVVYINWAGNTITSLSGVSSGATANYKKVGDFYRVDLTFTTSSTGERCAIYPDNANGTGSVYVWGAQLEQKPFATSYIRTEGAAVSRSSDYMPASNIEPQTGEEVTHAINFSVLSATSNELRRVYRNAGGNNTYNTIHIDTGGNALPVFGPPPGTINAPLFDEFKTDAALVRTVSQGVMNLYIDGGLLASAAAGVFVNDGSPTVIGGTEGGTLALFGHIKEVSVYNTALTAQEVSLL